MDQVEIYSHPDCGYCHQAKALLDSKEISYYELNVAQDHGLREQMLVRTGGRSLPQILINNQVIGGFSDLQRLAQSGELGQLLQPEKD